MREVGSPVIVLAAGGLDALLKWESVQPQLAALTRVCSFDAPGFGWSERAKVVSFRQTAIDLHTALHNALVDGPYVSVGHSNGGLVAQAFIHLYRDQVVGVVFDDSVSPKESVQFPKRFETSSLVRGFGKLAVRMGLLKQICKETAACPDCGKFIDTLTQLSAHYKEAEAAVPNEDPYGDIPLFVLEHDPSAGLSGERDEAFEKAWIEWQKELAARSTNSKLEVVSGVGHEIQTVKPALVVDAVQWVLARAKEGTRKNSDDSRRFTKRTVTKSA